MLDCIPSVSPKEFGIPDPSVNILDEAGRMVTDAKWAIIAVFLSPAVFLTGKSLADEGSSATQTTGELERLIASTGIDPQSLLNQGGEGGPYIARDKLTHHRADARTGELREIVKIL